MSGPTNAELQAMLKESKAREAEMKEQLDAAMSVNKDITMRGEGWLITSKNPLYDGIRHDVRFINGQAFLLDTAVVPDFVVEPMGQGQLMKFINAQYPKGVFTDEQRTLEAKAIRLREKRTSVAVCVHRMASDYNFKIRHFSADKMDLKDEIMEARVEQSKDAYEKKEEQEQSKQFAPGWN